VLVKQLVCGQHLHRLVRLILVLTIQADQHVGPKQNASGQEQPVRQIHAMPMLMRQLVEMLRHALGIKQPNNAMLLVPL